MHSQLRRRFWAGIAGFVLFCLSALSAIGAPITYVFSGPATGTLGTTPFTDAQVTVTGTANTSNINTSEPNFPCINLTSVTINITGIGTTTTTGPSFLFDDQLGSIWGFSNGTCASSDENWLDTRDPLAATYGLATAVGPSTGTQDFTSPVATAAGTLTFTTVPLTFTATLTTPAVAAPIPTLGLWELLLLAFILAGLGLYVVRGRHPYSS